jgi:hypothetical protein
MVVLYLWWSFDISQIFYFCSGRVIFAVVILYKTKPGRDGQTTTAKITRP